MSRSCAQLKLDLFTNISMEHIHQEVLQFTCHEIPFVDKFHFFTIQSSIDNEHVNTLVINIFIHGSKQTIHRSVNKMHVNQVISSYIA